jgi:hypothetical protein
MNLADPHTQAMLWMLAFAISELIGASKLKQNGLVQLGLKLFRIAYGSLAKKVSK